MEPTEVDENMESFPVILIRWAPTQGFGCGLRATVGFRGDGSVSALELPPFFPLSEIDKEDGRVAEAERGCHRNGETLLSERTQQNPLSLETVCGIMG